MLENATADMMTTAASSISTALPTDMPEKARFDKPCADIGAAGSSSP